MLTQSWIAVADALPDGNENVIIGNRLWSDPVWLGYHDGDDWYTVEGTWLVDDEDAESEDLLPPTHWMPMIPAPPPVRRADDPPMLMLPGLRPHVCQQCVVIDDEFAEMPGLYFVEHDSQGLVGEPWELCNACEAKHDARMRERSWEFSCERGVPGWHRHPWEFEGFEGTPMIVASDASAYDWRDARETEREVWLYCRDRREWRVAWEVARCIRRDGWKLFLGQERGERLLGLLPGYKPPGVDWMIVNTWKGGAR